MYGSHNLELSGDVLIIARKGRVHDAVPYHLVDMMIISQTRNGFVLSPRPWNCSKRKVPDPISAVFEGASQIMFDISRGSTWSGEKFVS